MPAKKKPANPTPKPATQTTKQPAKSSGMAITAFVLSLIFFIPFITQILAIVFGIISLSDKQREGKGFAIAALIISGIFLILWFISIFIIIALINTILYTTVSY